MKRPTTYWWPGNATFGFQSTLRTDKGQYAGCLSLLPPQTTSNGRGRYKLQADTNRTRQTLPQTSSARPRNVRVLKRNLIKGILTRNIVNMNAF